MPHRRETPSRRELKRRLGSGTAKYVVNPVVRGLFRVGLPAPGIAILETIGRGAERTAAIEMSQTRQLHSVVCRKAVLKTPECTPQITARVLADAKAGALARLLSLRLRQLPQYGG